MKITYMNKNSASKEWTMMAALPVAPKLARVTFTVQEPQKNRPHLLQQCCEKRKRKEV